MTTASSSSLITPPPGDLSVRLISDLLGPDWYAFGSQSGAAIAANAGTGAGTLLGQMFSTIDLALLAFVGTMLMYQIVIGSMATAQEGQFLGRKYNSFWAPLRAPTAFSLLLPLPWLKGFSILQATLLVGVYWGIGTADAVWNVFVDYVPAHAGVVVSPPGESPAGGAVAITVLRMNTIAAYLENRVGMKVVPAWEWTGTDTYGRWVYGFKTGGGDAIDNDLGAVSFACGQAPAAPPPDLIHVAAITRVVAAMNAPNPKTKQSPVKDSALCKAERENLSVLINSMNKLGAKVVSQTAAKPKILTVGDFVGPLNAYESGMTDLLKQAQDQENRALKSSIQAFSNQAKSLGWASSAFYFWTLTNIAQQSQQMMDGLTPSVTAPDMKAVENMSGAAEFSGGEVGTYMTILNGYQKVLETPDVKALEASAGQSQAGACGLMHPFNCLESKLSGFLASFPAVLTGGNPLAALAALGHEIITTGVWLSLILTGGMAAAALAGAVAGGVAGIETGPGALVTAVAGALGGAVAKGIIGAAAGVLGPVAAAMIIEGAMLAYVVPAMPAIMMTMAIIGWMLLVVELMVAAPLFAAAHVFADGDGIAGSAARRAYGLAASIVMRPVLLTFGFVFAFLLLSVGLWLLGESLQVFVYSLTGGSVGPIGFVALLAVILTATLATVNLAMQAITNLAKKVPQWIGWGTGDDSLGVDSAAQGAITQAKTSQIGPAAVAGGVAATIAAGGRNTLSSASRDAGRRRLSAGTENAGDQTSPPDGSVSGGKADLQPNESINTENRNHD